MRFFSRLFPNMRVWGVNMVAQFKDGVYDTDNQDEIKELRRMGFDNEASGTEEAPSQYGKTHTIPARWTTEKVKQYAEDNGIVIPDNITLRKDIIHYIENI